VLSEVSISARGYDPLLFLWALNLYAKTNNDRFAAFLLVQV